MEQGLSWEANQFSASQEIPPILWILKVHHHIHKCQPPVPILNKIDPVPKKKHTDKIYITIYYVIHWHVSVASVTIITVSRKNTHNIQQLLKTYN